MCIPLALPSTGLLEPNSKIRDTYLQDTKPQSFYTVSLHVKPSHVSTDSGFQALKSNITNEQGFWHLGF